MLFKNFIVFFVLLGAVFANKIDVNFLVLEEKKLKEIDFAFEIEIPKNHHIYTNNDPDSPTKIDIILPKNCTLKELVWPEPKILEIDGSSFPSYEGKIYVHGKIVNNSNVSALESIKANISYVVCDKLCTPGKIEVKPKLVAHKSWQINPASEIEKLLSKKMLFMIIFAFLGGIILNLMPCVLPVLSLKILHIAKLKNSKELRRSALFFTLGALFSFWFLTILLHSAKQAGSNIGWGFQLQSADFVICLSVVFFILALNLFGVFEIGTSFSRISNKVDNSFKPLSSFASGVLACVVATPCSAPFMGAAIGYALTQSLPHSMLIFSGLGLGFAAPYIVICCFPQIAKFLPKPGEWMINFKILMGFAMMASLIWLLHILSEQINIEQFLNLLVTFLLCALACWIYGKYATINRNKRTRIIAVLLSVCLMIVSMLVAFSNQESQIENEDWVKFSPKIIEEYKQKKQTVFIDFTAKWCITCQANKKLVLNKQKIKKLFAKNNVVLVRADWTKHDEDITKELAKYGRNSVPLYVLIRPDGEYEILPELLTVNALVEIFEKLKSGGS